MVNQKIKRLSKKRNSTLTRISIAIHAQLKEKAEQDNTTIRALIDTWLTEKLVTQPDTIRYFQEKYGNKQEQDLFGDRF